MFPTCVIAERFESQNIIVNKCRLQVSALFYTHVYVVYWLVYWYS
jgi:hypothetical protein